MIRRATSSSLVASQIIAAAPDVDVADLLSRHGVPAPVLADPDGRIPHALLAALWTELPRRTRDEAFGLHVAERWKPGAFSALDYLMLNAPDLGTAYQRMLKYQRVLHDAADYRLVIDGDTARFQFVPAPELAPAPPAAVDFVLATALLRGRGLIRERWALREARFSYPRLEDTREHARVFGTNLRFSAATAEVCFDAKILARPIPAADPKLAALLEGYAEKLWGHLREKPSLREALHRQLEASFHDRLPKAAEVARTLGLSERSLHRRLQEAGTTYQREVDAARHDLARRLLRDPQRSIAETAYLLGYAESGAFIRAFRRWTGTNPSEFRRHDAGAARP